MTSRIAFEEMAVGGVAIPRGTEVFTVLGAANRDPDAFDDPDRLDITRKVGRIMTFGQGIHFCLGAPLARLEGAVAFETLTRRMPELRLAGEPVWRPGIILHGLQSLPVAVS
jgi:cytochrome P450